jgi:hypothetical protein
VLAFSVCRRRLGRPPVWYRLSLLLPTHDFVGHIQRTVAGAEILQIIISIIARTDDVEILFPCAVG